MPSSAVDYLGTKTKKDEGMGPQKTMLNQVNKGRRFIMTYWIVSATMVTAKKRPGYYLTKTTGQDGG